MLENEAEKDRGTSDIFLAILNLHTWVGLMKNSLTMCGTKNELAEAKMNRLAYLPPRAAANLLLLQQGTTIDQSVKVKKFVNCL